MSFGKVGDWISAKKLEEKIGIPKDKIKQILARSVKNGTVAKKGARYSLIPLLPGIFEKYFIVRKDTEENQKKAARLYRDIFKEIEPAEAYEREGNVFRPLLPYEAKEKLIEIVQNNFTDSCRYHLFFLDCCYREIRRLRSHYHR